MPPKPRFASELTQRIVVAAVMVGLLLSSLALAAMLTRARGPAPIGEGQTIQIGELAITIPDGWQAISAPITMTGIIENRVQFAHNDRPMEKLWLAALPEQPARTSVHMIDRAKQFVTQQTRLRFQFSGSASFRHGLITGRQMATTTVDPRSGEAFEHHLLVFTITGRQYWMVYFAAPVTSRQQLRGSMVAHAQMMQRMCLSAQHRRLRPTRAGDFAAADLPDMRSLDDGGFITRIDTAREPNAPILVVPQAVGVDGLVVMRIRGTLNVTDPLSPSKLLAEAHRRYTGIDADDATPVRVAQLDARRRIWSVGPSRVLLSVSHPAWGLWYVPISDQRGLLIEAFFDHGLKANVERWARQLASLAVQAETARLEAAPDITPPATVDDMRARGVTLANHLRQAQQPPAERTFEYAILRHDGRVIGAQIVERRAPADDRPDVIEGVRKIIRYQPVAGEIDVRWTRSARDHTFTLVVQWTHLDRETGEVRTAEVELERQTDRLILHDIAGSERRAMFDVPVDESYISPLDLDPLPAEAKSLLQAGPVLAIHGTELETPQPHLVQWLDTEAAETENSSQSVQSVVQMRPIMAMEPQTMVFDATGALVRLEHYVLLGRSRGGMYEAVERVDRPTLLQRFPELGEKLTAWEQQHATPDDLSPAP